MWSSFPCQPPPNTTTYHTQTTGGCSSISSGGAEMHNSLPYHTLGISVVPIPYIATVRNRSDTLPQSFWTWWWLITRETIQHTLTSVLLNPEVSPADKAKVDSSHFGVHSSTFFEQELKLFYHRPEKSFRIPQRRIIHQNQNTLHTIQTLVELFTHVSSTDRHNKQEQTKSPESP